MFKCACGTIWATMEEMEGHICDEFRVFCEMDDEREVQILVTKIEECDV